MPRGILVLFQIVSTVLVQVERKKGFITSGVQFIFWLLLFIAGIIPFYSKILDAQDAVRCACAWCVCVCVT